MTITKAQPLDGNGNLLFGPYVTDTDGTQYAQQFTTPLDGRKATYSAGKAGLVPASSATDIFTITGATGKVVRVTRVTLTATSSSATPAALDVVLLRRSTANSSGTSTAPTAVAHDSTNVSASATVLAYTANPTTGTAVGTIRNSKFFQTLATYTATDFPTKDQITWDFGNRPSQAIVLRSASEVLAINLNGSSATSTASFDIDVEWTEEDA